MSSEMLEKAREYEAREDAQIPPGERPVFHVTPTVGWMNDPNGFSWYQGEIHLFYQYNPYGTHWDSMHWGHVKSRDYLKWERLPAVMAPDAPLDAGGVFSGSAVTLPDGQHLLMYTAVQPKENGTDKPWIQTQALAFGDGLQYTKYDRNPILTAEDMPDLLQESDFRDPKLWRDEEDGCWRAVVSGCRTDNTAAIYLAESEDARNWRVVTTLAANDGRFGDMWECPDFYQLDGRAVLAVSPMNMSAPDPAIGCGNRTIAMIGHWDPRGLVFTRESVQAMDQGLDFYASQTLEDPDGRRIMIAWMQSPEGSSFLPEGARWYGMMTVPRELHVREDGRLLQRPVRELERYRVNPVLYTNQMVQGRLQLPGISGRVLDMTVRVRPAGGAPSEAAAGSGAAAGCCEAPSAVGVRTAAEPVGPAAGPALRKFRVHVAEGDGFRTTLTWDTEEGTLCLDRTLSGFSHNIASSRTVPLVRPGKGLQLRFILDRFSVEIFIGDGEQVMSACIYTPQTADGISFEALGCAEVNVEKYDFVMT